jgi:hypothetical protein
MSDTPLSERRRRRLEAEQAAPPDPVPAPSLDGWLPIDDVALSGRPVVLRADDGSTVEAVYHSTRKFNRSLLKWEGHALWALRNADGAPVPFEPVGYRILE